MHYKSIILFLLASFAVSAVSCKDHRVADPDPEYMSGTLRFSIPVYAASGDELKLVPYGLSLDEGTDVGYYWYVTPKPATKDTTRFWGDDASVTGAYDFVVPDTLATLTVTCYAFADGYYNTSASTVLTVVDPDGTLTNVSTSAGLGSFTDTRDGTGYEYFTSGSLDWFATNLRYAGSGAPFMDCTVMDGIYGRYYDHTEAVSACPEGWRLPSKDDWDSLAVSLGGTEGADRSFSGVAGDMMVNAFFNGTKLWEYWPAVKITNDSGFGAIPTGYAIRTSAGNTFQGAGSYAAYWSSETSGEDKAVYRYIFVQKNDLMAAAGSVNELLMPVRCVREAEE